MNDLIMKYTLRGQFHIVTQVQFILNMHCKEIKFYLFGNSSRISVKNEQKNVIKISMVYMN